MTKKHFQLIASTLRALRPAEGPGYDLWFREVEALARTLRGQYPRFNYTVFLRDAGAL